MKKMLPVIIALMNLLVIASCEEESNNKKVCGVENPTTDLTWLSDIISQAENDQTGSFTGKIWIKSYQNTDYVVTNMPLGSGGLMFHCFDCEGNFNPIDDLEFYKSLNDQELVYTNVK
uniref:Lipoprotein n=1 Tax=Roseihalotalea indica TaxID=2867963 RepID=A0AA49GIX0_9BACT|nr:hypothetical protein K4G66_17180 [Tunicatimonas sp. TK19036]